MIGIEEFQNILVGLLRAAILLSFCIYAGGILLAKPRSKLNTAVN